MISERFIASVCARLAQSQQVRRTLPENGRLHIDRQLPFLCVYRKPVDREDWGTDRLAVTAASYMLGSASHNSRLGLSSLVSGVAETMLDAFGAFLIVEIWSGPGKPGDEAAPTFRIHKPKTKSPDSTVEALRASLEKIRIPDIRTRFSVAVESSTWPCPPDLAPILKAGRARGLGCTMLGLEVPAVYCDSKNGLEFPGILRRMRQGLHLSLKRAFFEFTLSETDRKPRNFHSLGRRAVVKAVWSVDRILAEVSGSFDFLLLTTPTNSDAQWARFRRKKYSSPPRFTYRPLPFDPAVLKRDLFNCSIDRIEDPTLAQMFTQMQRELDRKITMLSDRNTSRFLYGSLQVYDTVSDALVKAANKLLDSLPARSRDKRGGRRLGAEDLAVLATEEIDYYREFYPQMAAMVEQRKDIAGLLVSRGNLLVGTMEPLSESRARALIQHEIGTHVLTFYNAAAQPFQTLRLGLPGHEELQEGLAVLSEYLVGGMDGARLRLLAARVVAVRAMIDGASFVEVFRLLWSDRGFAGRTAFYITMRVFRGGGLTKDAVYLKGLFKLLDYLGDGGEFEPLYIGKVDIGHVPLIKELLARRVLKPMPLWPRHFDEDHVKTRLARVGGRMSVFELTEGNEQ